MHRLLRMWLVFVCGGTVATIVVCDILCKKKTNNIYNVVF